MMPCVEVAVGLPVPGTYHYVLPPALAGAARVGARVLVPFGARGVTGVIVRHAAPSDASGLREVRELLDEVPALDPPLVELCLWIADYYEAPPGEVIRAALPAGTARGWSAARPRLTEKGRAALDGSGGALPERARRALLAIGAGRVRLGPRGDLEPLVVAGLVELAGEAREARVRERTVAIVTLARPPGDDERAALARAPRRAAVLEALAAAGAPVDVSALSERIPGAAAAVRALAAQGLVERGRRPALRDGWQPMSVSAPATPLPPTREQAAALAELRDALAGRAFRPFLLRGVTGSGKTEVYLQAIATALEAGRGALVLVPEIALTPQLAARFRARFGDRVAVLHSGLSEGERYDQWRRLRAGAARIAVGARSAVFAPVADLGILVVDEEHDPSFKQEEGVRYHARDVALVRAQRAGAVCLLGSATPSLESYAHAREGRYRLLELRERPHGRPLPEVELVDLRTWRADPESLLSAPLATALDATLAAGDQAILFLNRRGFATFVVCCSCGHSFRCPQCSVSLTYHRTGDRLRCHYCGHAEPVPVTCPGCGGAESIRRLGLGTERIEDALRRRYPQARIARLDRDTAAGRGLRDVLEEVAQRRVDILVGTQMVTKGHDFPGVTLVGVLCADTALSLPDFRAGERTFQLLAQVAGRAGRGDRPGRVVVQTYAPDHPALVCARGHDYEAFFAAETETRAELGYPPHGRLVALRIDGGEEHEVRATADELATRAARAADDRVTVLGPAEAPLRRLKGRVRWQVWLKSGDRGALRAFVRALAAPEGPRGRSPWRGDVRVTVDVDPLSSL